MFINVQLMEIDVFKKTSAERDVKIQMFLRQSQVSPLFLSAKLLKLLASLLHLLEEAVGGVELGVCHRSVEIAGVDVALPVGTHDNATLAIEVATVHDGLGAVGIDLAEQQGGAPAEDGVARGERAVL